MLMTKKELVTVCGGLLMAGLAFGAVDVVKESFETPEVGAALSVLGANWTGAASVAQPETAYTAPVGGYVIGDAAHTKVLSIDDSIMYTPSSAISGSALVDMMVQAMVPEEELQAPEDADVQIAVGVDHSETEGKGVLKVFCTPKGGSAAAWCTLKEVDAGTWHRVTFVFDYSTGFAQVRIDGEPIFSDKGYLQASTTATENGAWYKLAVSKQSLTSVQVIGTTGLDDLYIAGGDGVENVANVQGADATGIAYAWYDKHGLEWNSGKTYDNSGLTLKAKYETGLSPFDGETFALKSMSMAGTKATFAIPPMTPPAGYAVQLEYSTTPAFTQIAGTAAVASGATSVELDLPEGTVFYYRLVAKPVEQ